MVTFSRGIRLPETRFTRIYELWRAVRLKHPVQLNEVFNVLLELGLRTYLELPEYVQSALFKRRIASEEIKFAAEVQPKIRMIASRLRLDDRLSFALSSSSKQVIREEAERSKITMSAVARRHILLREAS
jgi:hypothetical protein